MHSHWVLRLALLSLLAPPLCGHAAEKPPADGQSPAVEAFRQALLTMADMFTAIEKNDIETLKRYLDGGGTPDLRMPTPAVPFKDGTPFLDSTSVTLLFAATQRNRQEMVRLLLERGADPNGYTMGSTPLLVNRMEMDPLISPEQFGCYDTPTNEVECTQALQSRLEIGRMLIAHGGIADWGPHWRRQWAKEFRTFLAELRTPVLYAICTTNRIDFYSDAVLHQMTVPANIADYRVRMAFAATIGEWLSTRQTDDPLHVAIIEAPGGTGYSYAIAGWCKTNGMTVSDISISAYVNCDPLTVLQLFTDPENPLSKEDMPHQDFCGGPPYYGSDPEGMKSFFDSDIETIRAHYAEELEKIKAEMKARSPGKSEHKSRKTDHK